MIQSKKRSNGLSPLIYLMQLAVLPWRYDVEMGIANSLFVSV